MLLSQSEHFCSLAAGLDVPLGITAKQQTAAFRSLDTVHCDCLTHGPRQQKWTEKAHLTVVQSMLDSQREVLARLSTIDENLYDEARHILQ